jgi:trk system potassium uptake protein TrkH
MLVYVSAIALLLPGTVALYLGELNIATTLLPFSLAMLAVGEAWRRLLKPSRSMRLDDAIMVAVAAWILVPLLNALPISIALNIPFVDAWFEAVSGFTTTGLTMFSGEADSLTGTYVPSVDELPQSIQFWRSFIQWLGGVGILVLFTAFATGGGIPSHLIGMAEGRYEHLEPSIARSVRAFLGVYVALTVLAVALFTATGMGVFEALNHAMTGVATGGFSVHQESFAYYDSIAIEAAAIVVMVAGALNFADQYALIRGLSLRLLRNPETVAMMAIIVCLGSLGSLLLLHHGYDLASALRLSAFQFVSAVTGTGFQTMDLSSAPDDFKFLLTVACLLGGSIISTTGGIKMFRLVILVASFKWIYEEFASVPGRIVVRKLGGRDVSVRELQQAVAIVALFIGAWVAGTLAIYVSIPGCSIVDAGFEAASALGNVGLSTGLTGASTPLPAKLVMLVLMSIGRLEILPYILAAMAAATQAKLLLARRRRLKAERKVPRYLLR